MPVEALENWRRSQSKNAGRLLSLLERMNEDASDDATVLVAPRLASFGEDHLAELFREHLLAAKIERAELQRSTRTHVQANFRSCRDSGITSSR